MGRAGWLLSLLTFWVGSAQAAESVSPPRLYEARAFLAKYATLSAAQSPDFYELYSDRAIIRVRAAGRADDLVFRGAAYKAWSRELLQTQKIAIDASEFREGIVEERRGQLLIQAERFSRSHCVWDVDYQVALEREGDTLKIVEERIRTAPSALCAAARQSPDEGGGDNRVVVSTPPLPGWRPLSQEELARSALQLAQEWAARSPSKSQTVPVATTPTVQAPRGDPDAVLITPRER